MSIHVVKGPDRGKSSSAAGGESVHSGTGADLYVRWSNVAANPNVTSGERTYRQGNDRPCAGLRWPRPANPASGQSLHLPSALHDAHPLWRTQKIWTVIDIEVVSQHANAADVTTAQRGVPLQAFAGTGADDDPSSRRRPSHSSSRSNVRSNSRRGRALGYRATRTPADGRALRLVFCCSKSDPQGVEPTDWSCGDGRRTSRRCCRAGAFPISRSRAHTHRRHGHPLQTVPSAGLIERPQEKNRVDALR